MNEPTYKLELSATDLSHVRYALTARRRQKREILHNSFGTKTKQSLEQKITELEDLVQRIDKATKDPHVEQLEALISRAQFAIAAIKNGEMRTMTPGERAGLKHYTHFDFIVGEFAVRKI